MVARKTCGRCEVAIRLVATMKALLRGPQTLEDLASLHDVSQRTVRRDLYALEAAYVPVQEIALDGSRLKAYRLERL